MADVERKAVADMSVGEIKEALTSIGIDFSDCFEKADLIRKLFSLALDADGDGICDDDGNEIVDPAAEREEEQEE